MEQIGYCCCIWRASVRQAPFPDAASRLADGIHIRYVVVPHGILCGALEAFETIAHMVGCHIGISFITN